MKDSIKASVNDDDSYDNNSVFALTFTTSMTTDCCYHGMKMINGPGNSQPSPRRPPPLVLSFFARG